MEVQNEIEVVAFIMHGTEEDKTTNFTGEIMVADLDGNFIIGYRVRQGMLTHTVFDNNNSNKLSSKCETGDSCGFHMSQGDVVVTAPIPYVSITHIYPNNDGGGGENTYYSPGGGTGTVASTNNNDSTEEDKIDDSELDDCLKDILEDLKGHEHGVGEIIELFGGNNANFNWNVKSGTLSGGTGSTSTNFSSTTNSTTTTFDSNSFSSATDLSWARTILHESAHAYVVSIANHSSLSQAERNEFLGDNWSIKRILF